MKITVSNNQNIIEPITINEASDYLRLDSDAVTLEAPVIQSMITAAREYVEDYCDKAFVEQTWEALTNFFEVRLPGSPSTITTIEYVDDAGTTQTIPQTVYMLDLEDNIVLQDGEKWPTHKGNITITYTVGSTNAPESVIQAMRLLITHFYENRSEVTNYDLTQTPLGVESLLMRQRSWGV